MHHRPHPPSPPYPLPLGSPPLSYVQDYDESNPKTHKGLDLHRMSMAELYKYYDLAEDTIDFIGHALALHVSSSTSSRQ